MNKGQLFKVGTIVYKYEGVELVKSYEQDSVGKQIFYSNNQGSYRTPTDFFTNELPESTEQIQAEVVGEVQINFTKYANGSSREEKHIYFYNPILDETVSFGYRKEFYPEGTMESGTYESLYKSGGGGI